MYTIFPITVKNSNTCRISLLVPSSTLFGVAVHCTVYLFVYRIGYSTYRCGNYSREETIQGRKLFVEVRYANFNVIFSENAESVKNAEKSWDESIISHQKSVRVSRYLCK